MHKPKGSATIPDHVDSSRNHLDSLLESGNQVEICESGIIISAFILGTYETRNGTEPIRARATFICSVSSVLNGY